MNKTTTCLQVLRCVDVDINLGPQGDSFGSDQSIMMVQAPCTNKTKLHSKIMNESATPLLDVPCTYMFVEFDINFGSPGGSFWVYLEVLGDHFGVILVIKWGTDAPRGTLNGPRVHFHRFSMDFGSPIGDHLGSLFCSFCDLRYQKACLDCRYGF
jgi:hypothetical protein